MRWKKSASEALYYWMTVLGIVLSFLMFMVWQHVEAQSLERKANAMRKEEAQLVFQNARMQSQINQWVSPSHLESIARKELSMIPLDAQHRVGVEWP